MKTLLCIMGEPPSLRRWAEDRQALNACCLHSDVDKVFKLRDKTLNELAQANTRKTEFVNRANAKRRSTNSFQGNIDIINRYIGQGEDALQTIENHLRRQGYQLARTGSNA